MDKRSKTPKFWVSIDLEMNNDRLNDLAEDNDSEDTSEPSDYFGKLVISDIIQIGACVFNMDSGELVESLRVYVKLPKGKKLNPKIITLTGITEEILESQGKSLYIAYQELAFMVKKYDYFTDAISWGGNDAGYLLKELQKNCNFNEKYLFGSIYIDVKKIYQIYATLNNKPIRSGLGKSMTRLGMNFKGRQHDALDDAINTYRVFIWLTKKLKE